MIDSKLRFPHRKIPEPTNTTPPLRPNAAPPQPPTPPQRRHNNNREHRRDLPPSPPPNNPPSPPRNGNSRNYNPEGVGHNMFDSLAILGFTIQYDITERHIRRRYMKMVRKYHPDKNKPEETGRNREDATQFFQLLNNAQAYLQEIL